MASTKTSVKKRTFSIPKGFIALFFEQLENSGLEYELVEVDEDEELCVEIEYSSSERDEIMGLIELEDEFYNDTNDDEEHEEED